MSQHKNTSKAVLDGLRYWAFMIDETETNKIIHQIEQEEHLSTLKQERAEKHLSEGWESEWKHSFNARKENYDAESFKDWADEELKDHGDISFGEWADEEYEEPAHKRHLLLSFQDWADEEKSESSHHAEKYYEEDPERYYSSQFEPYDSFPTKDSAEQLYIKTKDFITTWSEGWDDYRTANQENGGYFTSLNAAKKDANKEAKYYARKGYFPFYQSEDSSGINFTCQKSEDGKRTYNRAFNTYSEPLKDYTERVEIKYELFEKMGAETFESPVSCNICGKTFASFRGLNGHMNAHHHKRAELELCDNCSGAGATIAGCTCGYMDYLKNAETFEDDLEFDALRTYPALKSLSNHELMELGIDCLAVRTANQEKFYEESNSEGKEEPFIVRGSWVGGVVEWSDGAVFVKVITFPVTDDSGFYGESMWVILEEGNEFEGIGILDNDPIHSEIKSGSRIKFTGGTADYKPHFVAVMDEFSSEVFEAPKTMTKLQAQKKFIAIIKPYWLKLLKECRGPKLSHKQYLAKYGVDEDDEDYYSAYLEDWDWWGNHVKTVQSGTYGPASASGDTILRERLPDTYYDFIESMAGAVPDELEEKYSYDNDYDTANIYYGYCIDARDGKEVYHRTDASAAKCRHCGPYIKAMNDMNNWNWEHLELQGYNDWWAGCKNDKIPIRELKSLTKIILSKPQPKPKPKATKAKKTTTRKSSAKKPAAKKSKKTKAKKSTKKKTGRKAPTISATRRKIGTRMRGNDGKMWQVKKSGKSQRWIAGAEDVDNALITGSVEGEPAMFVFSKGRQDDTGFKTGRIMVDDEMGDLHDVMVQINEDVGEDRIKKGFKTWKKNIWGLKPFASEGRDVSERMTREEAESLAAKVIKMVTPDVDFVEVCGSYRRGRQDPGDLDVVIILKEGITLPNIIEKNKEKLDQVNWMGEKKAQTVIEGHKVDFRTTDTSGKGAALLYFTGPAGYNIGMRRRAKNMGLKLNEYGIWDRDTNEYLGGATEEEIYEVLGKSYKSPTDRKGAEEIVQFRADDFIDEHIPKGNYIVEWTGGRDEFEWDGGPAMSFNDVWTDILWNESNITVWDSDKSKVFGAMALMGSTQKEFRGEPLGSDGW